MRAFYLGGNFKMAINEKITTGRKFRRLIDKESKLWQRISWWTRSSDVEFDDGKTAEQKLGAINGITSDVNNESEDIAASIFLVHNVDNKFGGLRFGRDENGNPGIIEVGEDGADTVIPFKKGGLSESSFSDPNFINYSNGNPIFTEPGKYLLLKYVAGRKDGEAFNYWIVDKETITNPENNTFKRCKEIEKSSPTIKVFAYVLDIKDLYAEFSITFHPGSIGGITVGGINQIFRLE